MFIDLLANLKQSKQVSEVLYIEITNRIAFPFVGASAIPFLFHFLGNATSCSSTATVHNVQIRNLYLENI